MPIAIVHLMTNMHKLYTKNAGVEVEYYLPPVHTWRTWNSSFNNLLHLLVFFPLSPPSLLPRSTLPPSSLPPPAGISIRDWESRFPPLMASTAHLKPPPLRSSPLWPPQITGRYIYCASVTPDIELGFI